MVKRIFVLAVVMGFVFCATSVFAAGNWFNYKGNTSTQVSTETVPMEQEPVQVQETTPATTEPAEVLLPVAKPPIKEEKPLKAIETKKAPEAVKPAPKRVDRLQAMIESLTKEYSLNPKQQEKLKDILMNTRTEVRKIMQEARNKAREEKIKAVQEIQGILNDKQKQQFIATHPGIENRLGVE